MADNTDMTMGTALVGGAVATALLEVLFENGLLTLDTSRTVLDRAMRSLAPVMQTPGGYQAVQIIGALQRGKFSARG